MTVRVSDLLGDDTGQKVKVSDLFGDMPWSEVGSQALQNAPSDAFSLAGGLSKLGTHQGLAEVGLGVGKVALGGAEKLLGFSPEQQISNEQEAAEGFGEYLKGYTSIPGIKKKIAEHPVSTAFDVATIATPIKGGGALRAAEAAVPRIKSVAQLKEGGGAALNAARESGVYFTSDFVKPLKDTLIGVADQGGFRPGRKGTSELSEIMKDVDAMSTRPWSFRDLHELGQDLNDAWLTAKKAGRTTVAGIAGKQRYAVRRFLDEVEKGNTEGIYATGDLTPERATQLHQEGLKIYRTAKTGEKAETMRALAENDRTLFTTAGIAHSIKKQARQILRQHHQGKPTGFNASELKTLEGLRDGTISDWVLQGARKFGGTVGAMVGASLGGPVGAGATYLIGKGAGGIADRLAMQRLNRFIEAIQADGSTRLQELLGQTTHDHLMGTTRGTAVTSNWIKKIGTTGSKGAAKSLALVIAQEVKRPDLVSRIEAELQNLVEEIQGTSPSEAQPNDQQ